MLTKKQYKKLSKKQLVKINKNQRGMIISYKDEIHVLHDSLEESIRETARLDNIIEAIYDLTQE